jgi:hypothetical protein
VFTGDEIGVMNAVGGGLLRDILTREEPFLFKPGQFYAAAALAGARHVVGLDTGFTHLAAALGRPTLGIYCDHEPGLAGITGPGPVASIGGKGQVPSRADVLALLERQLGG